MADRWLLNEIREFNAKITQKVDDLITKWVQGQIEDAERLKKLEGEIRAMKARAGKKTG